MNLSGWFCDQLQFGMESFLWAIDQVPAERCYLSPPQPLGEWNAAHHLFHMLYYEDKIALPSIKQWLGGPPLAASGLHEDSAWGNGHGLQAMKAQFRAVRAEQIALLPQLEPMWEQPRMTVWKQVPLRWVVTKTIQHTAEHTHDVLSLALFWDGVVEYLRRTGSR